MNRMMSDIIQKIFCYKISISQLKDVQITVLTMNDECEMKKKKLNSIVVFCVCLLGISESLNVCDKFSSFNVCTWNLKLECIITKMMNEQLGRLRYGYALPYDHFWFLH